MASQGQAQLNPLTLLITARSYISIITLPTTPRAPVVPWFHTTPNTYIQRVHRALFRTGERTRPAVTCFGPAGGRTAVTCFGPADVFWGCSHVSFVRSCPGAPSVKGDSTRRELDAAFFGQRNQVLTCRREALSKPQPLGNRHLRFVLVLAAGCASGSQPTRNGQAEQTLLRAPSPLNTGH